MMNSAKSKSLMTNAVDLLFTAVGCGIFSIAMRVFVAPNQIAPGGVTGIAIIVNHLIPQLMIGAWSLVINVPLLLIGLRFLGKKFTVKTLLTVLILSTLIDYVAVHLPEYHGNPLLAALFGGALMGTGLGIVFMRGSTTGGTDIVSRLLQLRYPHIQMGRILLSIDVVVILLSAVVFGSIEAALYGMLTEFTSAKMIDSVLYGMDTGKLVYVMSHKSVEISQKVINGMGRGCTLLKSTGGFTQTDSQVLLVAVRTPEYYSLKRVVHEIDPLAFMIVTDSAEVIGEGFKPVT